MQPILQALSQSLEHWQALYIIALIIAVLSTVSIIIFNFHLPNIKHGSRLSNYVYAIAASLTVIATLMIITKTRAIDAEKDREVNVVTGIANLRAAQAGKDAAQALSDAATANGKAEDTKQANLKLQIEVAKHEGYEKQIDAALAAQNKETSGKVGELEQRITPRQITKANPFPIRYYDAFYEITCITSKDDSEPCRLENDIALLFSRSRMRGFAGSLQAPHTGSPLYVPGVHIRYDDTELALSFATDIKTLMDDNGISSDVGPIAHSDLLISPMSLGQKNKVFIEIGSKP
jgi:hypothetical protein